jgi:hypothetical protein
MRPHPNPRVLPFLVEYPGIGLGDSTAGMFMVPVGDAELCVIASDGMGWDHVSVSTRHRCPTWDEMHAVKEKFFEDEECVLQFHPPRSKYVNRHPFTLHLWRDQMGEQELPPSVCV